MKRLVCLLLCVLCFVNIPLQATADIIVLPDNAFFQRPDKVFEKVGRQYVAKGIVAVYESPEDNTVVDTISHTDPITISHSYKDLQGVVWGLYDEYGASIGWIPMDSLSLVYDLIAFMEDHGEQVQETSGNVSDVYSGEYANFYSYPGSPDYELCAVTQWNYGEGADTYSKVYTDENGHTWIMVDIAYAIAPVGWIDLMESAPVPQQTQPDIDEIINRLPEINREKEQKDPLAVVALVLWIVALVMVTWLLLLVLKKKK